MSDCTGSTADRLRLHIERARSAQELWLLRNDVYQCIARQGGQSLATERINGLMDTFEGFIDQKQMARIK